MSKVQKILKEFALTSGSIRNKTSVLILTVILVFLGLSAYKSTPKESFPEITQPTIFISTFYPGNSPRDIENLVTRAIEQEVNTIAGIKDIESTSVQDFSSVTVNFNPSEDVENALREVKDAVDRAKVDLPNDLPADPTVMEFNFANLPVMYINLYGNVAENELKEMAEYLEDEMEKFTEVDDVELVGTREKEVEVAVDLDKLQAVGLGLYDVEMAIIEENLTVSAGDLLNNEYRRSIRVDGEYDDPNDMRNMVIKAENGRTVYLKDVADISFDFVERDSYARMDGKPVVTLNIKKRSGENIIVMADKIKELLAESKSNSNIPSSVEYIITGDQSKQTDQMVMDLENNIISGVILVALVLMFFLGLRNAMFVGIAIPLSMLMGILLVSAMGFSLNMMVLFSLILALGMLVDNGIVVVENVYRLMSEGYSSDDAAKFGVGEIAWPIIASTATTLAAFTPLLFWNNLMGEFMRYLPITLMVVLGSSLFVALVINPVLASLLMKVQEENTAYKRSSIIRTIGIIIVFAILAFVFHNAGPKFGWLRGICTFISLGFLLFSFILNPFGKWFSGRFMPFLEKIYNRVIGFSLRGIMPVVIVVGTFILLIGSAIAYFGSKPNVVYFPDNIALESYVYIDMPLGTDIEATNTYTKKLEKIVAKTLEPYVEKGVVESTMSQVGKNTGDPAEGSSGNPTPHKARITTTFVDFKYRNGVNTNDIVEDLREAMVGLPGATIIVDKNSDGPPAGEPVNIEITGDDYETLVALSTDIKNELISLDVDGIEELQSDLESGKPELLIQVNRDAARRYGLSTQSVAFALRTALFGKEISKFKQGEDDYEIWLRLSQDYRYDLNSLLNMKMVIEGGIQIPLSAVADIEYTSTYGSVKHKDLDRVVTLYSNVTEGNNATAVNNELRAYLADRDMPEGYSYKFSGEQESQQEDMAFLMTALIIAVSLIFLIIVSQFNSVLIPFVIMLSVLFSMIGVFIGLNVFNVDFVVIMMMIGLISLAGIVVNNAIVLIDYTNLVRDRKRVESDVDRLDKAEFKKAIMEGGRTRLRPVLLTAITTVLGLIPLAVGLNIDFGKLISEFNPDIYIGGDNVAFWGPMAWTIIFGLVFATFLTLIVVPVMYYLQDRAAFRFKRLFQKKEEASEIKEVIERKNVA